MAQCGGVGRYCERFSLGYAHFYCQGGEEKDYKAVEENSSTANCHHLIPVALNLRTFP